MLTFLGCAARQQVEASPGGPKGIAVQVRDDNGEALAGVNVTIFWLATQQFAMMKTDASGLATIEIPDLSAADASGGRYRYRLVFGRIGYATTELQGSLGEPPVGTAHTVIMSRESN